MSTSRKNNDKEKNTLSLSSYKFKTTDYVILKSGTRRDSDSGRLVSKNSDKRPVTT